MSTLKAYWLWSVIGWLMLASVVVLSLIRLEQPVSMNNADKLEHLLAYFSLMYWWGMLLGRRLWLWAGLLIAMGVGLEWVQGTLPYRHMDWHDAAANTTGVVVAWVLLLTPASRLLAMVDQYFFNRQNSG